MAKKKKLKVKSQKSKAKSKKTKTKKKKAVKKAAKKGSAKKKPAKKRLVAKKKASKKVVKKKANRKPKAKTASQRGKLAMRSSPPHKPRVKKVVKKAKKRIVAKKTAPKKAIAKKVSPPRSNVEKEVPQVQQQSAQHNEHQESFTPHVTSLRAGDNAPDFSGPDQNGRVVSLSDFDGKTLILYFYPKDDTEGCTAESCSLRDEYEYINAQNHEVVGVSADDVESHQKFAEKFNLPFSLVADTNMYIIRAYDVWGKKRLFDHIYDGIVRTTFIIRDRKIQRVITSVNTKEHGKQVMEG